MNCLFLYPQLGSLGVFVHWSSPANYCRTTGDSVSNKIDNFGPVG